MPGPIFPARSVIVSCQAGPDNPLHGPASMAVMAQAAVAGGAAGIRANGVADVTAIRAVVDVPILGINKIGDRDGVFITPTYQAALSIVAAGAEVVAVDGTLRPRPDAARLADLVAAIKDGLGVPVMADVDTFEAGVAAREAGVDLVGTTLSGYTAESVSTDGPDLELVRKLAHVLECPVLAEGRFWTREDVQAGFEAGAHAVVVGTAITNPMAITRRMVDAVQPTAEEHP